MFTVFINTNGDSVYGLRISVDGTSGADENFDPEEGTPIDDSSEKTEFVQIEGNAVFDLIQLENGTNCAVILDGHLLTTNAHQSSITLIDLSSKKVKIIETNPPETNVVGLDNVVAVCFYDNEYIYYTFTGGGHNLYRFSHDSPDTTEEFELEENLSPCFILNGEIYFYEESPTNQKDNNVRYLKSKWQGEPSPIFGDLEIFSPITLYKDNFIGFQYDSEKDIRTATEFTIDGEIIREFPINITNFTSLGNTAFYIVTTIDDINENGRFDEDEVLNAKTQYFYVDENENTKEIIIE